jgi:predicted nucleic acid-binding protein
MLVDTGAFVAVLLRRDPYHRAAVGALRKANTLVTTWPVLTEAWHMLPQHAGIALLRWADSLVVADLGDKGRRRVIELVERYRDAPMDLADASLIAVAEMTGEREIATIDFDEFETYRTADGRALRNVIERQR